MKSARSFIILASLVAAIPVFAQDKTPGQKVGETVYNSIDETGKGQIHQGDMERFRASIFAGMDFNSDARITFSEFSQWDPGFAQVAADEGKPDAYKTASRILFSFWDRNGDDTLTETEMRFAVMADFRRADVDDDSLLSKEEFLRGFSAIIAMRAAIRPDSDYGVK